MKKILKETPEGESNKKTDDLHSCITELSGLQDQVDDLLTTSFDDDETKTLELMKNKLSFISSTLNTMVAQETNNVEPELVSEADNDPSVNMTTDEVLKTPDTVKKLEDNHIDVNLTDDDGDSLLGESLRKKVYKEIFLKLKKEGLINEELLKEGTGRLRYSELVEISNNSRITQSVYLHLLGLTEKDNEFLNSFQQWLRIVKQKQT